MNKLLKEVSLVFACLFALTGQALADLISDSKRVYDAGNYSGDAKLLMSLAQQGDASSQYKLGVMYAFGQGVPQDYKEAAKWYRLAAERGDASAQTNLGIMYSFGLGVSQDYKEAVKWYRLAAEQVVAIAQYDLGFMYLKGEGVPQDYKEALKWYRQAAEHGFFGAQRELGYMYSKGVGVPQDYVLSHMWIDVAIANADREQQKEFIGDRESLEKYMTASQIAEAQELAKKCTAQHFMSC
jgi:uncharacterized protein